MVRVDRVVYIKSRHGIILLDSALIALDICTLAGSRAMFPVASVTL